MKTWFLCDRRACPNCHYPQCKHTSDPEHAENFEMKNGELWERERVEEICEESKYPGTVIVDTQRLSDGMVEIGQLIVKGMRQGMGI